MVKTSIHGGGFCCENCAYILVGRLAHDPAEEREGVASSDFLDVRVGVAPLDQTTDDVLAIGGGLQAIEVGRWQLFRLTTQDDPMKLDVIAHTGIGADPYVINADELDHIVIVIQ